MVDVLEGWPGDLEVLLADPVESSVLDRKDGLRILNELIDGQHGVAWLGHDVGNSSVRRARQDREVESELIAVVFAQSLEQEGTEA